MGKNKAEWLKEARSQKITGLSMDNTVAEIRAAIGKGPSKPGSRKAKSGEQLQEERLARSRANRDQEISEQAQAVEARAQAQLEADVANRSAAQQALDRAESA